MYAIIIPSKDWRNLSHCLAAIHRNEQYSRVFVVDDGLETLPPSLERMEITVLDGRKPFIFARNCNAGMLAAFDAGAEVVVLLNDDALLETVGGLTALCDQVAAHPEYGLIGAVTNVTGQPLQMPQNCGLREVNHIAFVCVAIPRTTVEGVQWLDERYCLDYGVEDRDLCEACTRAGLKVGVFDGCFVDHGSLRSTYRGDPRAPSIFQQNLALFRQKWQVL